MPSVENIALIVQELKTLAEKKGKFEFDDKLKEGAAKVGGEIKEHGGELKKDISGLGSKIKKKIKD